VGPVQSIRTSLRNTFRYAGRAPRSEFWWTVLAAFVLLVVAVRLDMLIFGRGTIGPVQVGGEVQYVIQSDGPITGAATLFAFFPLLAATVRRLHDRGRIGWWLAVPYLLFALGFAYAYIAYRVLHVGNVDANGTIHFNGLPAIPLIALLFGGMGILIWNFISLLLRSQTGPNRYGPNPLEVTP